MPTVFVRGFLFAIAALLSCVAPGATQGYPDRVVYAVTEAGRETARTWLHEMLRTTHNDYPDFIAVLSILFALPPDQARGDLELRAERLAAERADIDAAFADAPEGLPRLFLLEEECRRAIVQAELDWVRSVVDDLREGRLTWSEAWLRDIEAEFLPDQHQDTPEGS